MKKIYIPLLFLVALLLQGCGLGYTTLSLSDMKLSIEANEGARINKNTATAAVVSDSLGSVIEITRVDRTQMGDAELGRHIISLARKYGLSLESLEGNKIDGSRTTGAYVIGEKADSVIVIGGFIGQESVDGYISVLRYPKSLKDDARYSIESVAYGE